MELRESLMIVWRRRWLVMLAVVMAGVAAFAHSARQQRIYIAQAKVFIGPGNSSSDLSSIVQQVTLSQDFLTSYAEVLRTRPLAQQVVQDAHLPVSPDALLGNIKSSVVPSTRIIAVTVADTDPARAQLSANTLVSDFVKSSLTEFNGQAGVLASVLEPATLPAGPTSPKPVRDAALGVLLGFGLGVGIAFLLNQLDSRLRSREEVERIMAPLPTLASIPVAKSRKRELVLETGANSPGAEAFRILRTNAQFFSLEQPFSRVLVASAQGEDGKTTVAINLAASLAASGARTLLVEADLRRPTASQYFGTPPSPGLSDVLVGSASFEAALYATRIPNLTIVPAGTVPMNPSELLGSTRMVRTLDELSEGIDVMVVDTPPALVVTDAALLAMHVDGVMLVVRAGRTHRQGAVKTKELFERMGARMLGVVVNFANPDDGYGYPYHYQYYSEHSSSKNGKASTDRRPKLDPGTPEPFRGAHMDGSPYPPIEDPATRANGSQEARVPNGSDRGHGDNGSNGGPHPANGTRRAGADPNSDSASPDLAQIPADGDQGFSGERSIAAFWAVAGRDQAPPQER